MLIRKKIKIPRRQAGLAGLTNQGSLPSGARSLLGAGWARETPGQISDPQVCPGARVLTATTGLKLRECSSVALGMGAAIHGNPPLPLVGHRSFLGA